MTWSYLFFKQKTAYEMRISDWSSDVCSSDLVGALFGIAQPSHSVTRRSTNQKNSIIGYCHTPATFGEIRCLPVAVRAFEPTQDSTVKDRKSVVRERVCKYV